MLIFFVSSSDPMLTGTVVELNALAEQMRQFARSSALELVIAASASDDPSPYSALLPALRLTKRSGPIFIERRSNGELSVAGSADNLDFWASRFLFPPGAQDGNHHHFESDARPGYIAPGSLSTIIEVRED